MKLYVYRQNNSGGSFHLDETVAEFVIIEADNPEESDSIAEDKGVYFDGVENGSDCECCGDRWSRASEWDEINTLEHPSLIDNLKYIDITQIAGYVYYKDGSKKTLRGIYEN